MVTADPNATVDAWITGGLQFANGAAYSYVVLVGTGNEPWARSVHGAQVTPLLDTLLQDLAGHAKQNAARPPATPPDYADPSAAPVKPTASTSRMTAAERARVFSAN